MDSRAIFAIIDVAVIPVILGILFWLCLSVSIVEIPKSRALGFLLDLIIAVLLVTIIKLIFVLMEIADLKYFVPMVGLILAISCGRYFYHFRIAKKISIR